MSLPTGEALQRDRLVCSQGASEPLVHSCLLFNDSSAINAATSTRVPVLSETAVPKTKLLIKTQICGSLSLQGRPNRRQLQDLGTCRR